MRAGTRCSVVAVLLAFTAAWAQAPQGTNDQASNLSITEPPVVQYVDDAFAVITWGTSGNADSRVFYGTDPQNLNQVAESPRGGTAHRVDISKLKPNTAYYFQVDLGQAENTSPNQPMLSFRTVAPGAPGKRDVQPTQVSGPQENYGTPGMRITRGPTIQYADDHSAVISWSTEEPAPTIVYYGADPNNLTQTAESGTATFHRLHLSNLNPQTTYYFLVDSGQGRTSGAINTLQTVAAGAPPASDVQPGRYSARNVEQGLQARPAPQAPGRGELQVPAGTEIHAALETALSSKTSQPGDTFTAVVSTPVRDRNGVMAIPAGTRVRGQVTEAEQGKTLPVVRGRGKLNLRFIDMTLPGGTSVPLQATLASVNDTATGEEGEVTAKTKGSTAAKDVGIGAGAGTIAGLIFGSALKGLLIGAIAGGGYVLATKGKDVELAPKTGLVLQLDHDLNIPAGAAGSGQQGSGS